MDRKMQKAGRLKREIPFYLMLLPGIIVVFIYQYIPLGGLVMAFQDFDPSLGIFGSPWAGLSNFDYIFSMPDTPNIIFNTFFIFNFRNNLNILTTFFRKDFANFHLP